MAVYPVRAFTTALGFSENTLSSVRAKDGRFKDWLAPFDVHVYRFH